MPALLDRPWSFIWGPIPLAVCTVYIAYQGLVPESERSRKGILAAAIFLVIHAIVRYILDRLASNTYRAQALQASRQLASLVSSLGDISGDSYHLWRVDLYTAHWRLWMNRRPPFIARRQLIRRVSFSLGASQGLDDDRLILHEGPVGICFDQVQSTYWIVLTCPSQLLKRSRHR